MALRCQNSRSLVLPAGRRPRAGLLAALVFSSSIHPRAHEEAGIVVDQHEELGALGAGLPRLRHERADENVTDPDLVATRGLVAPEGLGRIGADRRPASRPNAQMLAQRPLSQADPVGTGDDLGDLGSRPGRHLAPEPHRLGHELGVGASVALVGAWFGLEAERPSRR